MIWRSCRGAVSLFLLIIMSVLLLFTLVFVDYARILTIELETERLAKIAARSVLSSFDPLLQTKYGLFIEGTTHKELICQKIFSENDACDLGISLLNFQIEDYTVEMSRPLTHATIFKRQILEKQKYIGLIQFYQKIVEKFKGVRSVIKQAKDIARVLQQVQKYQVRRKDALQVSFQAQEQAYNDLKNYAEFLDKARRKCEEARAWNQLIEEEMQKNVQSSQREESVFSGKWNDVAGKKDFSPAFPVDFFERLLSRINQQESFHQRLKNEDENFDLIMQEYTDFFEEMKKEYETTSAWEEQEQEMKKNMKEINRQFHFESSKQEDPEFNNLKNYIEELDNLSSEEKFDDPYQLTEHALKQADIMMDKVEKWLIEARDRILIHEYMLQHFPCFSSKKKKDMYTLKNQELEFIMYGKLNSRGNLLCVFRDITFFRMAVNMVDGLYRSLGKGDVVTTLFQAVCYSMTTTVKDMSTLYTKGEISFSNTSLFKLVGTLTYQDHLRLLMLFQGDERIEIKRMIALIQLRTSLNLNQKNTYAKVNVKGSAKLWGIPLVMKGICASGLLKGKVKGNRYYADKNAFFSY